MLQAGAEPDLSEESSRAKRGGELGMHDLERDRLVMLQVVGQVNRGHPAAAELAVERVAVGQGGLEGRIISGDDDVYRIPREDMVARD